MTIAQRVAVATGGNKALGLGVSPPAGNPESKDSDWEDRDWRALLKKVT